MTHIQQRRDQAAVWTMNNPVLYVGEAGHETDTGKWKLGDGVTAWNALPYKQGVDSVAGKTGVVALVVADVAGAAPSASPVFTGNPTAPTQAAADNDTSIATTAFVKAAIAALVAGSPTLLDTLDELAQALGDDPNFAATMTTALSTKAPLASPTFTGDPKAPTPATADNDTSVATTAFVKAALVADPPRPGEIIAATIITAAGNLRTTTSGAVVDLSPYTVTFTVPPSGAVKVHATGLVSVLGGRGSWVLREGSTELNRMWMDSITNTGTGYHDTHLEASFVVTGLTPGAVKTYKLSMMAETTATAADMYMTWGGGAPGVGGQSGTSLFEVSAMI